MMVLTGVEMTDAVKMMRSEIQSNQPMHFGRVS